MIATFEVDKIKFNVDFELPLDISIPMFFDNEELKQNQPNNYNVPYAKALPYQDGQFIGRVGQGGTCNFDTVNLIPHCNGTHTECIGHITIEKQSINQTLKQFHKLCLVISVEPIEIKNIQKPVIDYYPYNFENIIDDKVINFETLINAIKSISGVSLVDSESNSNILFNGVKVDSIAIRTLPNSISKQNIDYMAHQPTYLTNDAMLFLNKINIKHLLLDLPSVDRQFDKGKLSSHHIFWGLEQETNTIPKEKFEDLFFIEKYYNKTITEMIFINNEIKDGLYLLNLQIAPFELDAAVSKPVLYEIQIV